METAVVNEPENERYAITADGAPAGFTQYRERPGLIAFVHTEVDPRFEGQGVGSALIRFALDDARARELTVLPFCPFVNAYISKHPDEYAGLVPDAFREKFGL
jgi:uncharacterized protein